MHALSPRQLPPRHSKGNGREPTVAIDTYLYYGFEWKSNGRSRSVSLEYLYNSIYFATFDRDDGNYDSLEFIGEHYRRRSIFNLVKFAANSVVLISAFIPVLLLPHPLLCVYFVHNRPQKFDRGWQEKLGCPKCIGILNATRHNLERRGEPTDGAYRSWHRGLSSADIENFITGELEDLATGRDTIGANP